MPPLSPGQAVSSKPGSFHAVPRSVPDDSCRQILLRATSGRTLDPVSGKLRAPGVPPMATLEVQFSGASLIVFASFFAKVVPDPSGANGQLPPMR